MDSLCVVDNKTEQIVNPIGVMHSCYKALFGIPRQPGLVAAARGWIEFFAPYDRAEAFVGLEGFSHLWLTFLFHQSLKNEPRLTVRPPRLGGSQRLGVFATRAPNRPNQLGLSVVEIESIKIAQGRVRLYLKGVDLVEGTPIIDIKPYLPYVDVVEGARGGFAATAPELLWQVIFSAKAEQQVTLLEVDRSDLRQLVVEVLQYDPRPTYYRQKGEKRCFGMRLYDLNVRWEVLDEGRVRVFELHQVEASTEFSLQESLRRE